MFELAYAACGGSDQQDEDRPWWTTKEQKSIGRNWNLERRSRSADSAKTEVAPTRAVPSSLGPVEGGHAFGSRDPFAEESDSRQSIKSSQPLPNRTQAEQTPDSTRR